MPHGLIPEINVCKPTRQKIYVVFYDMKCSKSSMMCESGRVTSRKSVYFGISKLILYFPDNFHVPCIFLFTVYFHVPCTVHFTVYFRTVISMFLFLCYWLHSNAKAVNKTIQLCFYQRFTIGQSFKRRALTAENE